MRSKRSQIKKVEKKIEKKVVNKVVRQGASGVPRVEAKFLSNAALSQTHDCTREAATAYLQPFTAYESRLMPCAPIPNGGGASYGFWTRNVAVFTDLAFGVTTSKGSSCLITPWAAKLITIANNLDAVGAPTSSTVTSDIMINSMVSNFEDIQCCFVGIRVKNTTPVMYQGGECLVGRFPYGESAGGYTTMRGSGTSFVKSAADPGVGLTLSYQGIFGMTPSTAGFVTDYCWAPPTAGFVDAQQSCLVFRSQSDSPQSWEIEIVSYYLARPYVTASAFFSPLKHEIDIKKFNQLIDNAQSKSPELGISRAAFKDDGEDDVTMKDLSTIWNGAKALGKVASAAWSGLTSFFGLSQIKRHNTLLHQFKDDDDLKAFIDLANSAPLNDLKLNIAKQLVAPPLTNEQIAYIRSQLSDEFELLNDKSTPAPNGSSSQALSALLSVRRR